MVTWNSHSFSFVGTIDPSLLLSNLTQQKRERVQNTMPMFTHSPSAIFLLLISVTVYEALALDTSGITSQFDNSGSYQLKTAKGASSAIIGSLKNTPVADGRGRYFDFVDIVNTSYVLLMISDKTSTVGFAVADLKNIQAASTFKPLSAIEIAAPFVTGFFCNHSSRLLNQQVSATSQYYYSFFAINSINGIGMGTVLLDFSLGVPQITSVSSLTIVEGLSSTSTIRCTQVSSTQSEKNNAGTFVVVAGWQNNVQDVYLVSNSASGLQTSPKLSQTTPNALYQLLIPYDTNNTQDTDVVIIANSSKETSNFFYSVSATASALSESTTTLSSSAITSFSAAPIEILPGYVAFDDGKGSIAMSLDGGKTRYSSLSTYSSGGQIFTHYSVSQLLAVLSNGKGSCNLDYINTNDTTKDGCYMSSVLNSFDQASTSWSILKFSLSPRPGYGFFVLIRALSDKNVEVIASITSKTSIFPEIYTTDSGVVPTTKPPTIDSGNQTTSISPSPAPSMTPTRSQLPTLSPTKEPTVSPTSDQTIPPTASQKADQEFTLTNKQVATAHQSGSAISAVTFAVPVAVSAVIHLTTSISSGVASLSSSSAVSSAILITEIFEIQQNTALFSVINSDRFPSFLTGYYSSFSWTLGAIPISSLQTKVSSYSRTLLGSNIDRALAAINLDSNSLFVNIVCVWLICEAFLFVVFLPVAQLFIFCVERRADVRKTRQSSSLWFVLGFSLRVVLLLTTGLCLAAAYQIAAQTSMIYTGVAIVIILIVSTINFAGAWKLRLKSKEELEVKENKLKLGAYYLDLKFERRFFCAFLGFEKIIVALVLGIVFTSAKGQISAFFGFSVLALLLTLVLQPYQDRVFHWIKVSVRLLRIFQICLTFALVFSVASISTNVMGYIIISLNSLTLVLFMIYGVYRLIRALTDAVNNKPKAPANVMSVSSTPDMEIPVTGSLVSQGNFTDTNDVGTSTRIQVQTVVSQPATTLT
jgi:hypothetical protein